MIDAARGIERGGAECVVICTNTMHKMARQVQEAVEIPLIHIADATATAIKASPATRPLLMATRYTMEQDFYKERLLDRHGIEVVVPDDDDRAIVHNIIYDELCRGVISPESKRQYLNVISRAERAGADGVILGCTEVGLLIGQSDLEIPAFDTTELHAMACIGFRAQLAPGRQGLPASKPVSISEFPSSVVLAIAAARAEYRPHFGAFPFAAFDLQLAAVGLHNGSAEIQP